VHNLAIEQRELAYQLGHSLTYKQQANDLPELKQAYEFLKESPAQALQQTLKDVETAYTRFYKGFSGKPRHRSKGEENDAYRYPQPAADISFFPNQQGYVQLPKLGTIHYSSPRSEAKVVNGKKRTIRLLPYEGELLYVTIKKEGSYWWAVFTYKTAFSLTAKPIGEMIGVDMGVTNTVTLTTGEYFHLPRLTDKEFEHVKRLQRRIDQTVKDSQNRHKAAKAYQRYLYRLRCRKLDALHKLTTRLTKNHGVIVIEDLNIKNMTKSAKGTIEEPGTKVAQKSGLNRVILDSLWGEFKRQLQYKSDWYGSLVVKVPPQGTSQECSQCGVRDANSRKDRDTFHCIHCDHTGCADRNAAKIIRSRGEKLLLEETEGTPVLGESPNALTLTGG
jgi:putative transposase